jgi:hypothetical protein
MRSRGGMLLQRRGPIPLQTDSDARRARELTELAASAAAARVND